MKVPCSDCISFAICKQRVREWTSPPDITTFSRMIDCESIAKFIDEFHRYGIIMARKLYGLPIDDHLDGSAKNELIIDMRAAKKDSLIGHSFEVCDCNPLGLDTKEHFHEIVSDELAPKAPKEG